MFLGQDGEYMIYEFEQGMTWREWVESPYNIESMYRDDEKSARIWGSDGVVFNIGKSGNNCYYCYVVVKADALIPASGIIYFTWE